MTTFPCKLTLGLDYLKKIISTPELILTIWSTGRNSVDVWPVLFLPHVVESTFTYCTVKYWCTDTLQCILAQEHTLFLTTPPVLQPQGTKCGKVDTRPPMEHGLTSRTHIVPREEIIVKKVLTYERTRFSSRTHICSREQIVVKYPAHDGTQAISQNTYKL